MEKFVADYPAVIVAFIGALVSLIYLVVRIMFKGINKRISNVENDVKEQAKNYTQKFKEVHDKIDSSNKEVLTAIGDLKINLTEIKGSVESQVAMCKLIQKNKGK